MTPESPLALLTHPTIGRCDLLRIEGVNWVIRTHSDGKLHRVPPGSRGLFRRDYSSGPSTAPASTPVAVPLAAADRLATIEHPDFGVGDLIRVEVTDWIIRFRSSGFMQRFPSTSRRRIKVLEDFTTNGSFGGVRPAVPPPPTPAPAAAAPTVAAPAPPRPTAPAVTPAAEEPQILELANEPARNAKKRLAIRVVESLRNGLPPSGAIGLGLCIGHDQLRSQIDRFLEQVDAGGAATVFQGSYGHGKTFYLRQAEQAALDAGYAIACTEVDATENMLSRPDRIYRSLMSTFQIPGIPTRGVDSVKELLGKGRQLVDSRQSRRNQYADADHLEQLLKCPPIAWLLSDPELVQKPELVQLFMAQPGYSPADARKRHRFRGTPRDWPTFSAGNQGDFGSLLLSGIGRLCRLVGYKGLILSFDEMERWQDLNWKDQARAGNLLGGLIWAATAPEGQRDTDSEPPGLSHSLRGGHFNFTTPDRCNLGILIAMTPRGDSGPESTWREFGPFDIVELPMLSDDGLRQFCHKIAPFFSLIEGRPNHSPSNVKRIADAALYKWTRRGELTMRSGMVSVVEAFDETREFAGAY